MGFWKVIIALGTLSGSVRAEYRLYQYLIKPKKTQSVGIWPKAYRAVSSLDPVSYQSYHGGSDIQEISLLRSWMCVGHTGGRQPCPAPLDLLPSPGTPVKDVPEEPTGIPPENPS